MVSRTLGGEGGAHLGASLYPRVPADRHHPGAGPADVLAQEPQVDDGSHRIARAGVLGDAHGPDEDGALGPGDLPGKPLHVLEARPGDGQQLVHGL